MAHGEPHCQVCRAPIYAMTTHQCPGFLPNTPCSCVLDREAFVQQAEQLKSELQAANLYIEELEGAMAYSERVMENYLRHEFADEEGVTWLPGFSTRRFVEIVGERIDNLKKMCGEETEPVDLGGEA